VSAAPDTTAGYDVAKVRADFPILATRAHGKPLVYLDSAASAQKPRCVIDAVSDVFEAHYANIHRGVYELSADATTRYEEARTRVARFLGAADPHEIVFVRNATEAVNLVAQSFGRSRIGEGDEILITEMEHHSNIVPWQLLCDQVGARLVVAAMDDSGALLRGDFEQKLRDRTKLVAMAHVSNALGTINPVEWAIELAHAKGVPVLLDGAQAAPHMPVDVTALDADFYAVSGHKLFGPGVGALYGKRDLLDAMPPFMGGGGMIEEVSFEKTTWAAVPERFEAGTPDIAGVIGFGVAVEYLESIGMEAIEAWEQQLLAYATPRLEAVPGLRLVGTAPHKASVLSFVLEGVHAHDVGTILDREGVAIRVGHHCAQPVMAHFGVPATARASVALYNTREDVDALVAALGVVRELFG